MSGDVLERNVRALLRRSYVPALPSPHFRDRLRSDFVRELARRAAGRESSRVRPVRRRLAPLAAVAAVLVALLFGWRLLDSRAPTRAGLLERGAVALRAADGEWRAASSEEAFHGLAFAPPRLVVATPAARGFTVLAAGGRVELDAASELELAAPGEGVTARLRAGGARFVKSAETVELVRDVALELALPRTPPPAGLAASGTEPAREPLASTPAEPPADAAPPTARVLRGTVLDAATGEPVPEFTLAFLREYRSNMAFPPELFPLRTDAGTFVLAEPPRGKQRIFAHAPGFALLSLGERDLSGELPDLTLALERGASVRGRVVDARGAPVADALVLSEDDAPTDGLFLQDEQPFWLPARTRTGPDGTFLLEHLSTGTHTLRASAPGLAPAWVEDARPGDADELLFTLGSGGTIAGRVTRPDGGPWADARMITVAMEQGQRPVMTFGMTATDAQGEFRFEHVPPITMIVVLLGDDDRPEVRPVTVPEGGTVRADFVTARTGTRVVGRLLAPEGTPVPFHNVGLFDRETATRDGDWVASATDEAGRFSFDGVAPGEYLVYLIDEMGRGLRCVDRLEVIPGMPELARDVRLPSTEVSIVVRAAADGRPAAEAEVHLYRLRPGEGHDFAGMGVCDAEGLVRFSGLPAGDYEAVAYPTGPGLGFSSPAPATIDERRAETLEILLEEGGALEILVRDPSGTGVEGASVVFVDEHGFEHDLARTQLTDAAGRYRAVGLRPGRYRVQAWLDERVAAAPIEYDLGRPAEQPLILTLDPLRTGDGADQR